MRSDKKLKILYFQKRNKKIPGNIGEGGFSRGEGI